MSKTTCEVWICVDANGDYGTGKDQDAAKQSYADDIGSLEDADGFRLYRLDLTVPMPEARTLAAEVTETDDTLALAVS